jgi:hypothetical protein
MRDDLRAARDSRSAPHVWRLVSRIPSLAVTALILAACAVPSLLWRETEWEGALIEGNLRPRILERCNLGPSGISDVTHCDRAFVDHHGAKVDVTRDVRDAIDQYLPKVSPLKAWLHERRPEGGWKFSRSGPAPFKLYILTISPTVVLAVPQKPDTSQSCSAYIFHTGCLPTGALTLSPYWFKGEPAIRPKSFWFAPVLGGGVTFIPEGAAEYVIEVEGARINLVAKNDKWLIRRPGR